MKLKRPKGVFILCILLLCTLFTGCGGKKQEKLRICIDLGSNMDEWEGSGTSEQRDSFQNFLDSLELYSKTYRMLPGADEVELEFIPSDDGRASERSAMLQRIRTEIMTGGGPDVFLCGTEGYHAVFQLENSRLFPYAEKAIQEEYFLPLDNYLNRLELTDRNDLTPEILAGGQNSWGEQVLVPMRYSVPSIVYRQREVPPCEMQKTTWKEALQGEDPVLSEPLRWGWSIERSEAGRNDSHQTGIPCLYPQLVDFSSNAFLISEEELTDLIWENVEPIQSLLSREPISPCDADLPDSHWIQSSQLSSGTFPSSEDLTMLPMPNAEGGATAVVYSYCAINRNTQMPEKAAAVLDYLLSEIGRGAVFGPLRTVCVGMPVNQQALTPECTGLSPATLEEWKKILGQVNVVHFPSRLDTALNETITEIQTHMKNEYDPNAYLPDFFYGSITREELSEIVHTHYAKMKQLVEES